MSFTTLAFAIFLLIVFSAYWLLLGRSYRLQNILLLFAGYVFYGWWDWRFLALIFITTVLSWGCGLVKKHRKSWATVSIVVNLLILCVFKYYNFFGSSLQRLIGAFGGEIDWFTIDVLLPVGISFYTFQAVSYSVDVYKKRIEPSKNLITYSVYISFFPQLVAGPIERAGNLLPQFERPRKWDYAEAVQGMRQILWGLFKKCVVADGIAMWVINGFYYHLHDDSLYGNFHCLVAVIAFALQIYGDFSGYSDIARGCARLFGIKLMNNFLYPFFSRNAIELWHRWHRSLMQWFTEYVYIPLGGSRKGSKWLNVMIVFLLSGIWHGANFTFILWGTLCGIWYIIAIKLGAVKYRPGKDSPATLVDLPKIAVTFVLFILVFVAFRSENLSETFLMYRKLIIPGLPVFAGLIIFAWLLKAIRIKYWALIGCLCAGIVIYSVVQPANALRYLLGCAGFVFGAVMLAVEWKSRTLTFALQRMPKNRWVRIGIYTLLYIVIFSFAIDSSETEFIYFQF